MFFKKCFRLLKELLILKIRGSYKCGCPVGTKYIWRDDKGRIRKAGDVRATMVQCCGCGKIERINDSKH